MGSHIEMIQFTPTTRQLAEICSLIDIARKHDCGTDGYFHYTPDYLEWLLDPRSDYKSVVVGAFDNRENKLAGCNIAIPRNIWLNGRRYNAAVSTLHAVHPEYRDMGLEKEMIARTHSGLQARGAFCNMFYEEHGRPCLQPYRSVSGLKLTRLMQSSWLFKILLPNRMSFGVDMNIFLRGYFGKNMQLHFYHDKRRCMGAKTFRFYGNTANRFFRPGSGAVTLKDRILELGHNPNEVDLKIKERIFELLYKFSMQFKFSRVWSRPELDRHLDSNYSHTFVLLDENDSVKGFVNYVNVRIFSTKIFSYALHDILYISGLEPVEVAALVFTAEEHAKNHEFVAAIAPDLKYFRRYELIRLGYIPFIRRFDIWLSASKSTVTVPPVNRCYIDIR
jgi:hypothetical protein